MTIILVYIGLNRYRLSRFSGLVRLVGLFSTVKLTIFAKGIADFNVRKPSVVSGNTYLNPNRKKERRPTKTINNTF